MMTDSDSGSAGADQSGVPPPPIEVGASYKANDLAKMAQKLSTYMNRGSEVAWTQKPGNAPRSLACRNGRGFHRDPLSQIE